MTEHFDPSVVDWSRAQFALTAIYHWLFVPLTLGLSFMIAIMETIYVKTGNPEWKKLTKFWMTLFGVNFAIGVASGIILEFEFGTNWSNYSWFVGDIFGAPLAIEGIMAFFMESTFIAIMFFGWNKVSKGFHLTSTWLVFIGSNISALWILVANGWMEYPAGMHFNPDTARNEMLNFWDVLLSPVAINKFFHTIASGYVLAAIFVAGISAWFLLKNRDVEFAKRSIKVAAIFGLLTSVYLVVTGDSSARIIARKQPMKFAAFEGLYNGQEGAPLTAVAVVSDTKSSTENYIRDLKVKIEIPNLLSYLAYYKPNAFIPGVNDLIKGNQKYGILSAQEKIQRGTIGKQTLKELQEAKKNKNIAKYDSLKSVFASPDFQENYFKYFGYSFISDTSTLVPSVPLVFYSFRIMVFLGFYFIILFILLLYFSSKGVLEKRRKFLWLMLLSIPLPYLAGQAGWIVTEVGRQPWVIQDYLPTAAAVSRIDASAVQITFFLFAILFTSLLIAEISILRKQIRKGPEI
jgi:cytochrome d ubiquinol oxidase subunit I